MENLEKKELTQENILDFLANYLYYINAVPENEDVGYVFDVIPKKDFSKSKASLASDALAKIVKNIQIDESHYTIYDNVLSFKRLSQEQVYFLMQALKPYKKLYHISKPRFIVDKDDKFEAFVCGAMDRTVLKSEIDWINKCKPMLEGGTSVYTPMYTCSIKEAMLYSETYLVRKYKAFYTGRGKPALKMYYREFKNFMDNLIRCR